MTGETQSGSRPNTRSGNSTSGSKSKNKPSPSAPSSSKLKPNKGKSPSLPKLDKVKSPSLLKPNKGKSAVPSSSKNDKKTAGEDLLKDFNDAYAQGAVPAETQLRTSREEKQLNKFFQNSTNQDRSQSSARKASALKSPAQKGKAPAPKSPIASKTATPKDFGASFSDEDVTFNGFDDDQHKHYQKLKRKIDEATSDIKDEDADVEESEQETDNDNDNDNDEEEADDIADDAVPIDTMMVKDVTRPCKQKKGTHCRKHKSKVVLADFVNIDEAEELLTLAKAVYRRETCFKNMFPATDLEHQPAYVDANYASSSVQYDFGQTARPLICAKLQLASGDNDRVFHHDQLDLKTATSTGHPFRSDLIPEILQLVLFDEKSKTDGLILRQLNELEYIEEKAPKYADGLEVSVYVSNETYDYAALEALVAEEEKRQVDMEDEQEDSDPDEDIIVEGSEASNGKKSGKAGNGESGKMDNSAERGKVDDDEESSNNVNNNSAGGKVDGEESDAKESGEESGKRNTGKNAEIGV
ncbi:hypothetical protein BT96DRAFT_941957 [Gymnopus androsaceus JB14]|uniref:Uncharacterized protein n=1 Tax=Gymnopus androsaceus JB14 TaxID=1447944 RepID=A0A6A4HE96_9AGAR|nr:hypothetical protein BT96DRAFT_941957 [Gymnopus androsaceus JB14]